MSRMHYRPNEFADLAGVSVKTLHRWDSSGKLKPLRTIGGHRYYTDEHINQAEQTLRGDLVTHVAVHGTTDIGSVLSYTLLIKKIERIGDQAKNILDLAEEGVSLVGEEDISELLEVRRAISAMFAEAADLMAETTSEQAQDFYDRATVLRHSIENKIREYMHSDMPASYAVPRAVLYRYWKRIVANLAGVVTGVSEPLQNQGYTDDGQTDLDD